MQTPYRLGKRSRYPWLFLALVLTANLAIFLLAPEARALELYLTITGGIAGFFHFLYAQHHENTQVFTAFFKEANERYDRLNERLNAISGRSGDEISAEDTNVLYDYFNLCAEEYLFFKSGYIDADVWRSWLAGMKFFCQRSAVRALWEQELLSNSYYGFRLGLLDEVP